MQHLITKDQISKLALPISSNIKDERVDGFIAEAETMYVKPILGDALYIDLLDIEKQKNEAYLLLLDGGQYRASDGTAKSLSGLRTANAYYAYARIVKCTSINVTNVGVVYKSGDHSQSIDNKQILRIHDDAVDYGNRIMKEILVLLQDKPADYPLFLGASTAPQSSRRVTIISIGS